MTDREQERPDPSRARAVLERIRRQRAEVEALVADLSRERHLNNFAGNVFGTTHERRRK